MQTSAVQYDVYDVTACVIILDYGYNDEATWQ